MSELSTVSLSELRRVVVLALRRNGFEAEAADALANYVTDAESSGRRTHGLQRLPGLVTAKRDPAPRGPVRVSRPGAGLVRVDGNGQLGLLVAQRCVEEAIAQTGRSGAAMVVATGFSGSTGALGYFSRQAASCGLLAVVVASCESGVAPEGGVDPVLGTNPIAISFPHDPVPITLDMATSAVSYGTLELLAARGLPAPAQSVLDAAGRPSTDPRDALTGAQLPMAGHKGYGLGLLVELLAGPMIGGKAGRAAVPGSDGLVVVTTRVDHFRPRQDVTADTDRLVTEIRSGRRRDPDQAIRVPGERSEESRLAAARSGRVRVDPAGWLEARRLAGLDD